MTLKFRTHRDDSGFVPSKHVELHGPKQPGTMVTHRSFTLPEEHRNGVIVGVHDGVVDVVWSPWKRAAAAPIQP